jgi:hypothetical protein
VLPAHARRKEVASAELRRALAGAGYDIIDPAGIASLIPRTVAIHACNGCEIDIARKAGAELVVTGHVHKVSTLILSMTLKVADVATGQPTAAGAADIRGDNDRAWLHGVAWLVRNRLSNIAWTR